jgi:[ribosomal protein S5]-alanine N-acetyltransferase
MLGNRLLMAKEPKLITGRLILQPTVVADAEELFCAYGDEEVMRFWDTPPICTVAEMKEMLSWVLGEGKNDTSFMWSVLDISSSQILGMVSYHHLERWHRRADISFLFARPHWGKGFATEALTALIDYCFNGLLLHRLVALVDPSNERSHNTVQRLGFREEGALVDHICAAGQYHTVILYGLISGRQTKPGSSLQGA